MIALIRDKQPAVTEACRRFGVARLEVFGSAARGDFDSAKSDVDFIASFQPPLHPGIAGRFFGLATTLEAIFARPVDLLTDAMLRNPVLRQEVNTTRSVIYDDRRTEAAA